MYLIACGHVVIRSHNYCIDLAKAKSEASIYILLIA